MKKLLLLVVSALALLGCSVDGEIKDFLEERTNKVVDIIKVSERREYVTKYDWDNGTEKIQDGLYSYRVKYSIGDDIYFCDVIYSDETNNPVSIYQDGNIKY